MATEEMIRAAKALKSNPLLEQVFDASIKKCFEAWQAEQETSNREQLWHRVKAIHTVRLGIYDAVKSALRDEQQ